VSEGEPRGEEEEREEPEEEEPEEEPEEDPEEEERTSSSLLHIWSRSYEHARLIRRAPPIGLILLGVPGSYIGRQRD